MFTHTKINPLITAVYHMVLNQSENPTYSPKVSKTLAAHLEIFCHNLFENHFYPMQYIDIHAGAFMICKDVEK